MTTAIQAKQEQPVQIPSSDSSFEPYSTSRSYSQRSHGVAPVVWLTKSIGQLYQSISDSQYLARHNITARDLIEGSWKQWHFQSLKCIGEGVTSQVFKAVHLPSHSLVALKVFKQNATTFSSFNRERTALQATLRVPYMIKMFDDFVNGAMQGVLVLPLLTPDLHASYLHPYIPDQYVGLRINNLRKFAYQLLVVLEHLEVLDIIHADIKPHNLSFNHLTGYLVVFDLGHAIFSRSGRMSKSVQSPYYRAPEVYLGRKFDHSIDMWSAGCVFFESYTGKAPFPSNSNHEHMAMIVNERGMPLLSYIQSSPDAALFFKHYLSLLQFETNEPGNLPEYFQESSENKSEILNTEDEEQAPAFPQHRPTSTPMKKLVVNKAMLSKVSLREAEALWQLIDHMLRYENRISPTQALSSEFFQQHLLFELYFDPIYKQLQVPVYFSLFDPASKNILLIKINLSKAPISSFQSCQRIFTNQYCFSLVQANQKIMGGMLLLNLGSRIEIGDIFVGVRSANRPQKTQMD